jgi:5-methyltetrahydrofolate--homocysteine methyltransferase
MSMNILEKLSENLQKGETAAVSALTKEALQTDHSPEQVLNDGLLAGMAIVGEKFKNHDIFLPDVLLAARAMYAGLDILKPHLAGKEVPTIGKVVIGTVQGDLHDIGKNLVGILLKGAGFNVIDLGHDVPPEKFIMTAMETKADVIGLSALLTTTMPVMRKVVELAKERGIYGRVKIIIGGAPVSADYAREIGADAYCFDGMSAVDCVKGFVTGR